MKLLSVKISFLSAFCVTTFFTGHALAASTNICDWTIASTQYCPSHGLSNANCDRWQTDKKTYLWNSSNNSWDHGFGSWENKGWCGDCDTSKSGEAITYSGQDPSINCRSGNLNNNHWHQAYNWVVSSPCTADEYCSNGGPPTPPMMCTKTVYSAPCVNHRYQTSTSSTTQISKGDACNDDSNVCNRLPVATISSPAEGAIFIVGNTVNLSGSVTDPDGDTIQAYEWKIDGVAVTGVTTSFDKSDLGIGPHTITFRAQDSYLAWSVAATRTITVVPPAPTISSGCDRCKQFANISWTAQSGAIQYQVRIDTDRDNSNGFWYKAVTSATTLNITDAPKGFVGYNSFSNSLDSFKTDATYNVYVLYNKTGVVGWINSEWASFDTSNCVPAPTVTVQNCSSPNPTADIAWDNGGVTAAVGGYWYQTRIDDDPNLTSVWNNDTNDPTGLWYRNISPGTTLSVTGAPTTGFTRWLKATPTRLVQGSKYYARVYYAQCGNFGPYAEFTAACSATFCGGTDPTGNSSVTVCTDDEDKLTTKGHSWGNVVGVGSCTDPTDCEFYCNAGYVWNTDTQQCICASSTYDWQGVTGICQAGDNCNTKVGYYQCVNSCGGPATDDDCIDAGKPKPTDQDPLKTGCPCANRDKTYREVNP